MFLKIFGAMLMYVCICNYIVCVCVCVCVCVFHAPFTDFVVYV